MRLTLFFIFFSSFVFSQTNQQQKAYQDFQNGNYKEAIRIYKELSKQTFSASYYYPYFNSYFNIGEYEEAKSLALKMSKRSPSNLVYLAEISICDLKSNNQKSFNKNFLKLKKKLNNTKSQTINISNTFIRYQIFDYALDIYLYVEKKNKNLNFLHQKANLYSLMGKQERMIETYLKLLAKEPDKKQLIISNIEKFLDNDGIKSDKNYQLVKQHLLRYVQSNKHTIYFSEILIWLFMQNHQFKLAFLQAKALDKRFDEDGSRIYEIADIFLTHNYYDLAVEAYDYIISKQERNYFIKANIKRLYVLSQQSNNNPHMIDNSYKDMIKKLGKNKQTILLFLNYANFKAFSLYDLESAANILKDAMSISSAERISIAKCKLAYADIMLISNKEWEAILYYSQVEKEFKEHKLGHEAKLKRAKVAFFQGDFEWAKAQLDVLKSSTSKLIANDAMKLSLLITDNLELDTTNITMQMFAKAELLTFKNKLDSSLIIYDSILAFAPGHSLTDEIYFNKSNVFFRLNNLEDGVLMLLNILENYPYDILADDAVFQLGKIYENQLRDSDKAMYYYEKILLDYKGSIYTSEARKRFRLLRGDILNNSI
ncbi:MAG: tetratricopeptide repeat protein [Bacteroidota bacterium]|nr:tetratricopeptide repeat protein [Bacteroidota bacterium]